MSEILGHDKNHTPFYDGDTLVVVESTNGFPQGRRVMALAESDPSTSGQTWPCFKPLDFVGPWAQWKKDGEPAFTFNESRDQQWKYFEKEENMEEEGKVYVDLFRISEGRKILAIYGIRQVTNLDLYTAKQIVDAVEARGHETEAPKIISIDPATKFEDIATLRDHGLTAHFRDAKDREEERERLKEEVQEVAPLSLNMLALKLAMHGLTVEQVRAFADSLEGVEDASGSLRAAAMMMERVT